MWMSSTSTSRMRLLEGRHQRLVGGQLGRIAEDHEGDLARAPVPRPPGTTSDEARSRGREARRRRLGADAHAGDLGATAVRADRIGAMSGTSAPPPSRACAIVDAARCAPPGSSTSASAALLAVVWLLRRGRLVALPHRLALPGRAAGQRRADERRDAASTSSSRSGRGLTLAVLPAGRAALRRCPRPGTGRCRGLRLRPSSWPRSGWWRWCCGRRSATERRAA